MVPIVRRRSCRRRGGGDGVFPRLNRVPILLFVGGAMQVVAAVDYTYRERIAQAAANLRAADQQRPEPASSAAVLNGVPTGGEVRSVVYRPRLCLRRDCDRRSKHRFRIRRPIGPVPTRSKTIRMQRRHGSKPGRRTTPRLHRCKRRRFPLSRR